MNGSRSTPRRGSRLVALTAAVICVLALAAGAFVLSYTGARDTALTAGVTAHLARLYPGIFDAVLIVACAAALSLRGVLRGYAWLAILVIIAAVAAADAVHATSVVLPKRPMEATVAIVPWAVLLIGFTLLYAMIRQAWPGRRAAAAAHAAANGRIPEQAAPSAEPGTGSAAVPLSALLADRPATRPERVQAAQAAQAAAAPASKPEPVFARRPSVPATRPAATTTPPAATATPPAATATLPSATATPPPSATTTQAATATLPSATATPPPSATTTQAATATPPPATARPATVPEPLPARRPSGRDEPSDADAESAEPAAHFTRLRSTPTPPED